MNLQSSVNYTYHVRAFNTAGDGAASSTAGAATPQLVEITGTSGHDIYYVVRVGNLLRAYENIAPVGQPTYSSELAAMSGSLMINTGEGNDALTVDTGDQTALGVNQVNYNAGSGSNTLVLNRAARGSTAQLPAARSTPRSKSDRNYRPPAQAAGIVDCRERPRYVVARWRNERHHGTDSGNRRHARHRR